MRKLGPDGPQRCYNEQLTDRVCFANRVCKKLHILLQKPHLEGWRVCNFRFRVFFVFFLFCVLSKYHENCVILISSHLAEHSKAQQSRAEQSRAEQSRAEQSTAQHSTAQHSKSLLRVAKLRQVARPSSQHTSWSDWGNWYWYWKTPHELAGCWHWGGAVEAREAW